MPSVPAEPDSSMASPAPVTPGPGASPMPGPAASTIPYEVFAQLDLRVAKVVEAREHPNANKLLLLRVQVGESEKQIVAGIRGHYTPEQLVGRSIVIVNNLQPTMLRGETSQGMLLAASDGNSVVLISPEKEMAAGSRVK